MITLYAMKNTCAVAVHIALEWAQAPYKIKILKRGENHQPEYLEVNSLGSVPALLLNDGSVLTEAAALLIYINKVMSEKFEEPAKTSIGEARLSEKLSFFTSELHVAFAPHFSPSRFHSEPAEHDELKIKAYERISRLFCLADGALKKEYVFGEHRSVADPYLYVLTRWASSTPIDLDIFPNLSLFKKRMDEDPDVRKVLAAYENF